MRVMASNFFVFLLLSSNSAPGGETAQKDHPLPRSPISYLTKACSLQLDGKKPTLPDKLLVLRITRRTFQRVILMCPFFLHLLPLE